MASSKKIADFLTNWDDSPEQLELFIENASPQDLEILCKPKWWWGIIEKVVILYKTNPQDPKLQILLTPLENKGIQRTLLDSLPGAPEQSVIALANLCSGSQLPPPARAVFYLLSEQWAAYEEFDPDRVLFREYFNRLSYKDAQPLHQTLKVMGRTDILLDVPIYIAGSLSPTKLDQTSLEKLLQGKRFEQLWELAQKAAPCWSVFILKKLKALDWQPADRTALALFNKLTFLAEKIPADILYQLRDEYFITKPVPIYSEDEKALPSDYKHLTRILPGGNFLIREAISNTLQLCAIEPFEILKSFQISPEDVVVRRWATTRISDFEVSQDKSFIVVAGYWSFFESIYIGAAIWIFPIIEDKPAYYLQLGLDFGFVKITVSPDNSSLAISNSSTLILYHYTGQELVERKRIVFSAEDTFHIQKLAFSPDGKTLAVIFVDKDYSSVKLKPSKIQLWWMPDLEFVKEIKVETDDYNYSSNYHGYYIYCLKFSPDSKLLLVGPYLKWLWLAEEDVSYQTEAESPVVKNMAFSPDGKLLAMNHADGYISLHHMEGAFSCQLKVLGGRIISLEFGETGQALYVIDANSMLYSIDISLLQLYSLPISFTRFKDLERLARSQSLTANQQILHDFIAAQMQTRWQYDVELEVLRPLTAQEKDIELD